MLYPERYECPCPELDIFKVGTFTFEQPDLNTFTCLKTAIDAITLGGLKPTAVNGANEEAVRMFLDGKIGFLDIGEIVMQALNAQKAVDTFTVDDIFEADNAARELARDFAAKL